MEERWKSDGREARGKREREREEEEGKERGREGELKKVERSMPKKDKRSVCGAGAKWGVCDGRERERKKGRGSKAD
jgi:hypothetical protein